VNKNVWAMQLVEHAGKKVTKGKWSCWEKEPSQERPNHPRPVCPGLPAWPINGAPGFHLLQASSPLLPQFVCSSFCAQNHCRHSHPSWAWLLKQLTPLIHSKSTFRSNFWSA
jgi:hypothetical protein